MKIKKILLLSILAIFCFSCEKSTNYSAQLKAEKKLIEHYLAKNNIEVVNTFIMDSILDTVPQKIFYHNGEDSIYFRLISKGTGKVVETGDRVQVRYIESTLDDNPIVESYMTTSDLELPIEVIFGDLPSASSKVNYNSVGWQSAIRLMHSSEAVAEFIVPSRIGLKKAEANNKLTPYHYKFTFKILPK
ncbi:MAG: DUF4827 domain-containing protein [Prevotellaceae bacterium]|jgi:hypothetical protein|nr:DUF4827 domain-containing protein [Prevotellaceae bacterium]